MINKFLKLIFVFNLFLILGVGLFSSNVYALEQTLIPTFPTCSNPQGTTKVSYSTGTHGIVGDSATYTGADTVYTLTDKTLTQCFCPSDNSGIQTNWWKVSDLTIDQIESFQKDGWVYVPNGALWGLEEAPYLAKNAAFTCGNGGRGGIETSDNKSSRKIVRNRHTDQPEGDILSTGASTVRGPMGGVLGLATTGNMFLIATLAFTGVVFTACGLYFIAKQNENA